MSTREDAERRYAQIEGERDYHKRRADRLEAERDALAGRLEAAYRSLGISNDTIAEQDKEIAALAAHVERLRNLLKYPRANENRVHAAIIDTPTTSLARLKAKWQAEGLREGFMAGAAHDYRWSMEGGYIDEAEEAFAKFMTRRPAEGGDA